LAKVQSNSQAKVNLQLMQTAPLKKARSLVHYFYYDIKIMWNRLRFARQNFARCLH